MRPLPPFETSCSAALPISSETKSALEMLMVFINEANENSNGKYYFPDVAGAVEREYEAYGKTISDPDLMFIMTHIQTKLHQLLIYRTQLEDTFCEELLSVPQEELCSNYKGSFIIYQEKSYQIIDIDFLQREQHIVIKCKSTRNHTVKVYILEKRIKLDSKPISFPDTFLISQIDIARIWKKIEKTFIKADLPGELEGFLNTHEFPKDEFKYQLTEMLRQARLAQDFQFDVFAFHPPSRWVEKLILSTVQMQYGVCDPNFVTEVERKINGLSQCYDKSLYCSLYTQFLQETSHRGDSFKLDILETLEAMHFIFIDQNLSSLVTEQGLAQSGIEDADYIFCHLVDLEVIDSIGTFLPSTTEHTIAIYCNSHEVDMLFLKAIFFLQKSISQLPGKELSFWIYKLRELRLRFSLKQLTGGNNDACDTLLVHIYQMQRHYGELEVLKFLKLVCSECLKDIPCDELLKLFSKCSSKEWNFSIVIDTIEQTCTKHEKSGGTSHLLQALDLFDWESHRNKERNVQDIVDFIMSQHQQSKDTEHLKPVLQLIKQQVADIKERERCRSQFNFDVDDEKLKEEMNTLDIRKYSKCHIAHWFLKFKEVASTKGSQQMCYLIEAFAVIRRGITIFYETEKNKKGVVPRDTQMVASLLFFHKVSAQGGAQGTKVLQQICTGEGKTMILCMAAVYKVLLGEKVDVVTSSSVLATRDAVDQKPFYDMFNVTVAHCCHEELSKRCKAYEADVIYGDVGSFQRDILETDFYDRKIRTDRNFKNVFVDEVDSMLIDKGQNMLYLPHALPDMNCLDEVYLKIWSLVNAKDFLGVEQEQEQLYFALRHDMLGAVVPNAFTAILEVSEKESENIFEHLIKNGIIDSEDHCLTTTCFSTVRDCIETICDKHLCNEVLMIIQERIEAKPLIQRLPKVLHPFIKKSLRSWIHSAVCAKYFRPNKEYIIDIDHRESASDRYPKIIIMDNETGVEQESSEWGTGLHQFLQLKHNLRLSTESLKAVYMSNISLFTKYQNIMGVTGTLGSVEEHALFKQLYGEMLIVEVPTNKPSRMITELPLCFPTKQEWEEAVYSDVKEKLRNNRVVLLISEDVEGARYLQQFLKSKDRDMTILLYFSSHQEKLEEKGGFEPGQLIIATNLAGRGTDIKLTSEVKQMGGLHVCLSYLPPNVRVELQANGRCARSGDPGSCRMIFYNEERDLTYAIQKRNLFEAQRVSEIEADYFHSIKFQEKLFYSFTTLYNKIKAKHSEPEYRAVLDYCLDCWAFFLDFYTIAIESIPEKSPDEAKREKDRIRQAFQNEVQRVIEGLTEFKIDKLLLTPSRLLQLGHAFMKQEVKRGSKFKGASNKINLEIAVQLYRKAKISGNPFSLYYSAAAELNLSLSRRKVDRRALKQAFYEIMPMFHCKIRQCQTQVTILQVANRYQDQTLTGNTQYFQEQKQHEIEIYHQFISSMQDVIGKCITLSMFDHTDWGEEGARVVFRIVHKEFSLKNPYIAKNYCHRLENLLRSNDSYFTYEAKIRDKVRCLRKKGKAVTKDDLVGVLPDKEHFWNLMKKNHLITRETKRFVLEDADAKGIAQREQVIGYWNPKIDIDGVQLEAWDCLDIHSFDWIKGIEEGHKSRIYSILKSGHIINSNGQLMDLNLARPLRIHLPNSCVQYYKAIKDTLWHHTIYRFILDHLRDSTEIDVESDVSDFVANTATATHESVVDILKTLNKNANGPSERKVKHILSSVFKRSSGAASVPEDHLEYFRDHFPSEVLNDKLMQQLMENDMIATEVSGCGLNCMINAMIQHAKQDYLTLDFPEAKVVRSSLKQNHPHLDVSGMLHCDDEIACEVLGCVNDVCDYKIATVSAFIASSDGPILYGGTSDKRFPSGKHVALWQQGNHFVAVVHHHEFVESTHRVENEHCIDFEKEVPKLTQNQLKRLEKLKIVSKAKAKGKYQICKTVEEIESTLKPELISPKERDSMIKFLTFKLEVDYKTLSNSPRVLAADQSRVLYDDLCEYAVIKELKMKKTHKEIDKKFSELKIENPYWYKDAACWVIGAIPFYFDMTMLNNYLKGKERDKLTMQQYKELKAFLCEKDTIDHVVSYARNGNLASAVTVIHGSTKFLTDTQRSEVANFVLLMLQLRRNACFISSTLKNQQSTLLELESPEVSLRRLSDMFEQSIQEKGDVLGWFSDNQCDFLINLAEQKWSWKSIWTAVSVIAIGVAQIALGAVLLAVSAGSASFVCNAIISEGVSDMIFGIEGLVRGHCNWSQYFDHKILSITITIATAGIGAYLGRGVQASRYAYKAFGNASMVLAKSTAKQTGKSLGKVIAKQVGKKIIKKAAGAAVDAGINIACDKIVEEMSQSIDDLSQCIIDSYDRMTEDKGLNTEITLFLESQSPDKAERYLHQIFMRVMQRKTFLEIWDDIESKLRTGANVVTQAHGNASKHLQMVNKSIKGKRLMKGIGYASRFAPLISESVKIGLVGKKMDLLKEELMGELTKHRATNQHTEHLDKAACSEILKKEFEEMKNYLRQQISQRGRMIVTTGLQILGQELKKRAITSGKQVWTHKIKGHMDMKKLMRYKRKEAEAHSEKNPSKVAKYEVKLQRLMSRTRNPKIFAHLIEHHDAQLGPAFAIPALEKMIKRPIKLVNEEGEQLLNVHQQYATCEPLVVKFIPGKGTQPGHFYVGSESFSVVQLGNDCLIHAVMKGAGQIDYTPSGVRSEIAIACKDRHHPCYEYIRSGIARNYVAVGLIGAGRPTWWPVIYPFLKAYGTEVQGISDLHNCKKFNENGKLGLRAMKLDICHILSWSDIENVLNTRDRDKLNSLLALMPSIDEVREGKSVFGVGKGQKVFLREYKDNPQYENGVIQVRRIKEEFCVRGEMTESNKKELVYYLHSAPANLRLGDARMNRRIKQALDYCRGEQRSENIRKKFKGCSTEPKRDKDGKMMTSFHVKKTIKK